MQLFILNLEDISWITRGREMREGGRVGKGGGCCSGDDRRGKWGWKTERGGSRKNGQWGVLEGAMSDGKRGSLGK